MHAVQSEGLPRERGIAAGDCRPRAGGPVAARPRMWPRAVLASNTAAPCASRVRSG